MPRAKDLSITTVIMEMQELQEEVSAWASRLAGLKVNSNWTLADYVKEKAQPIAGPVAFAGILVERQADFFAARIFGPLSGAPNSGANTQKSNSPASSGAAPMMATTRPVAPPGMRAIQPA